MMLLPTLSCLVLLFAGHSLAYPFQANGGVIGEDASKWLGKIKVGQSIADAINNIAKVFRPAPTNCKELLSLGKTHSGVYSIQRDTSRDMMVYCDMETDGGGWLVIQRRKDGSQDFSLNWADYAAGFGNLNNEFWIGNQNLHLLTSKQPYELRIDLRHQGESRFAEYMRFFVGSEDDKFPLAIGGYSGTAGNSIAYHNGKKFSTLDADNDDNPSKHCANSYRSGWWYSNNRYCFSSNLNGRYLQVNGSSTDYHGIHWAGMKGLSYSLEFSEMKMRPLA